MHLLRQHPLHRRAPNRVSRPIVRNAALSTILAVTAALAASTAVEASRSSTATTVASATDRLTVTFADDLSLDERTAVVGRLTDAGAAVEREFSAVLQGVVIDVADATIDLSRSLLPDLVGDGLVTDIEAERAVTIGGTPSVTVPATVRSGAPWGLDRIDQRTGTDGRFRPAGSGAGVRVYILDSGIAPHPDLGTRIAAGINLMPDRLPTDTGDGNGHGTHIAGVIAGNVHGVADDTTVVPVRVLDNSGGGTTTGVIAGLDWVVATHPRGTPGIVNLSLDAGPSSAVDEAVEATIAAGLPVVVAAGNHSVDACTTSPARVPGAITVGATTHDDRTDIDRRSSFSNHGPCLDLFAPGESIRSTAIDGGTALMSGTSIAAPHVAGVLAAEWGRDPASAASTVIARLLGAATPDIVRDAGVGSPDDLVYLPTLSSNTARSAPTTRVPTTADTNVLPTRLADTRSGLGGVPATRVGSLARTGAPLAVPVLGRSGIPTSGVIAVAVNITATDTTTTALGGHLAARPCETGPANTSTLNFTTGETVANAAIVPVSADDAICIDVFGLAHIIVDINGYMTGASGGGFVPVTPTRRADTRSGIGDIPTTPISGLTMLRLPMRGRSGLPTTGPTAVSLNITATDTLAPVEGGYLTVFPCDTGLPNVSTLNFTTGQTIANAAIVPLPATGDICVYVYGRAHIIVDINGYMTGANGYTTGATEGSPG